MERKKRSKGRGWESCYVKKNLRDVWCRNESVRAEIGQILQTHRHTHASKLVVEISLLANLGKSLSLLDTHNDSNRNRAVPDSPG